MAELNIIDISPNKKNAKQMQNAEHCRKAEKHIKKRRAVMLEARKPNSYKNGKYGKGNKADT